MYGALLGDMIGAPYEFDMGDKTKDFPLFSDSSKFTDDSVMTIAVADALIGLSPDAPDDKCKGVRRDARWWIAAGLFLFLAYRRGSGIMRGSLM